MMVFLINLGIKGYEFGIQIVFLLLMFVFILANNVDPDEMTHYGTFPQYPHNLSKYAFLESQYTN